MNNLLEIRKIVLTAVFTALIIAGTYLAIPIGPVPIVLANFFAILAGLLLGPVYGSVAVLIYLLLGIMGLPVFSGGKAGFATLLGPTGGYLIGYLIGAFSAGVLALPTLKSGKGKVMFYIAALTGIAVIYIPGLLVLKATTGWDMDETLAKGLIPFIPGALLKIAVAGTAAWFLLPLVKEQTEEKEQE